MRRSGPGFLSLSLLAVGGLVLGCGEPPTIAPDAATRAVSDPCKAAGADTVPTGGPLVSGRYRLSWTPPCTYGAINPLESDELLDLDVSAGTAAFSDGDGGCVECAAVHRGSVAGGCLHVDADTVGASKRFESYALCATASGIVAEQVWSGYPGPPAPVTWRLTGVRE